MQAKLSLDGEYKMQVQLANQTQLRVYNKGPVPPVQGTLAPHPIDPRYQDLLVCFL